MKKAQGLSLQTIIIAAIVLIVLIVLWAIFTGQIGGFSKGVTETKKDCKSICTATGIYTGGDMSNAVDKKTCPQFTTFVGLIDDVACCCT
ncbi:MAG: hypothetical protein ABIJ08_00545 [Nanoarchaeota archaeon]